MKITMSSKIIQLSTISILEIDSFYLPLLPRNSIKYSFKSYCDESRIFPIKAILKHKQVACMRRKILFTIFKYLFLFQRYSSF